ncbi:hypothetical protein EXIGLDRAFT_111480 [Exidia glandulosa HHB12029]|uniref:Uncharacterized protein n=1 Tax=Exidia glandulosa HHB12029 TaxID=1314781 RepID=A0A165NL10_EXIGL|nr:hypothetical protein EXIGLDRAFT_111480 [Exidia glandulosa HHB12029]
MLILTVPAASTRKADLSLAFGGGRTTLISRPVSRKGGRPSTADNPLPSVPESSEVSSSASTARPVQRRPSGLALDVAHSQQREPIHVDHPYRVAKDPSSAASSALSSPLSSPQTEYEDLFFNASPDAPTQVPPPAFHLPFRASISTAPRPLVVSTLPRSPPQTAIPETPSRPVTGSTIASIASDASLSPGSTSNASSLDSVLDEVLTPADSPHASAHPFTIIDDEPKNLSPTGSDTPTLVRDSLDSTATMKSSEPGHVNAATEGPLSVAAKSLNRLRALSKPDKGKYADKRVCPQYVGFPVGSKLTQHLRRRDKTKLLLLNSRQAWPLPSSNLVDLAV